MGKMKCERNGKMMAAQFTIWLAKTDCDCIDVVLQNVAHTEKKKEEQHVVLPFASNKRE